MKLVDELYNLYKNKLTGDEEDIDMLAFAFLEEMSRLVSMRKGLFVNICIYVQLNYPPG